MFRRDIIMEQVERLTRALAQLAVHRKVANWAEAEDELARASEELLGMRPEGLLLLDVQALLALVQGGGESADDPGVQRGLGLARLLTEQGHIAVGKGDASTARRAFMQAFCVYDELQQGADIRADAQVASEMDALVERLEEMTS